MMRALLFAWFASASLLAQATPLVPEQPTGLLGKTITLGDRHVTSTEHRYVVYVPPGYTKERQWPLVVFLNGAGECGTDGWKHVSVGLAPAILDQVAKWPFVVLFPQKPRRDTQWEDHEAMVMAMLERTRADYAIDEKRLFLTGLSQGGHGTWVLGARHAKLWAAIAPVCGYGEPQQIAPMLKDMPIWCFHGEADQAVPVQQSKLLCAAVEKEGGRPELTLYPKVGHNSWDLAYRNTPLAQWFLATGADREGICQLADFQHVTRATVELRVESSTDAGPPFHTHTSATLVLDPKGLDWSVVQTHQDPTGKDGSNPEPRRGTLPAKEGRQFVVDRLQQLLVGSVFSLPTDIAPAEPKGVAMAWDTWSVTVTLEGRAAPWRFHRDVPRFASADPAFSDPVGALRSCMTAIQGLR